MTMGSKEESEEEGRGTRVKGKRKCEEGKKSRKWEGKN